MSKKKSFNLGSSQNSETSTGLAIRQMEASRTWKMDFIPLDKIEPSSMNENYTQNKIESLANSIRRVGLLSNLVVKPTDNGKYRLISGERRYNAIKQLTEEEYARLFPSGIPAKIEDAQLSEVDEEIKLIEANANSRDDGSEDNEQLTAAERNARWIKMKRWEVERLTELYKLKGINYTAKQVIQEVAGTLNITTRQVYTYQATNKLLPGLQEMMDKGILTLTKGSKIGSLPEDAQTEILSILKQTHKISDDEIRRIKTDAEEKERKSASLEAELKETRTKLDEQTKSIQLLEKQLNSNKESSTIGIEDLVQAKERLQKDNDNLQRKIEQLTLEKANIQTEKPTFSAEDKERIESELKIVQSINSIEQAIKVLLKNKQYLQDEEQKAKVITLASKLTSITTGD